MQYDTKYFTTKSRPHLYSYLPTVPSGDTHGQSSQEQLPPDVQFSWTLDLLHHLVVYEEAQTFADFLYCHLYRIGCLVYYSYY